MIWKSRASLAGSTARSVELAEILKDEVYATIMVTPNHRKPIPRKYEQRWRVFRDKGNEAELVPIKEVDWEKSLAKYVLQSPEGRMYTMEREGSKLLLGVIRSTAHRVAVRQAYWQGRYDRALRRGDISKAQVGRILKPYNLAIMEELPDWSKWDVDEEAVDIFGLPQRDGQQVILLDYEYEHVSTPRKRKALQKRVEALAQSLTKWSFGTAIGRQAGSLVVWNSGKQHHHDFQNMLKRRRARLVDYIHCYGAEFCAGDLVQYGEETLGIFTKCTPQGVWVNEHKLSDEELASLVCQRSGQLDSVSASDLQQPHGGFSKQIAQRINELELDRATQIQLQDMECYEQKMLVAHVVNQVVGNFDDWWLLDQVKRYMFRQQPKSWDRDDWRVNERWRDTQYAYWHQRPRMWITVPGTRWCSTIAGECPIWADWEAPRLNKSERIYALAPDTPEVRRLIGGQRGISKARRDYQELPPGIPYEFELPGLEERVRQYLQKHQRVRWYDLLWNMGEEPRCEHPVMMNILRGLGARIKGGYNPLVILDDVVETAPTYNVQFVGYCHGNAVTQLVMV